MVAASHQLQALEEALAAEVVTAKLETALYSVLYVAADAYHLLASFRALDALSGRELCDESLHRLRSLRAKLDSADLTVKMNALQAQDHLLAAHIEALRSATSMLLRSWERMTFEVRKSLGLRLNPNGRAALLGVIDEQLKQTETGRDVLETLRQRVLEAMPPRAVQLGDLPDDLVDDLLRAAMQQARFADLAEIWRNETSHLSSTTTIVRHPAYREIIEMGPVVVPLILRELARRPAHWGPALAQITGERPVSPGDAGQPEAIAAAWLRWGREHGHSW